MEPQAHYSQGVIMLKENRTRGQSMLKENRNRVKQCIHDALSNEYKYWGALSDDALVVLVKSQTGEAIVSRTVYTIRRELGFPPDCVDRP